MASLSRLDTVTACVAKGSAPPVSAVELFVGESGEYLALAIVQTKDAPRDQNVPPKMQQSAMQQSRAVAGTPGTLGVKTFENLSKLTMKM